MPEARADGATPVKTGWLAALTVAAVVVLPLAVLGPAELYARNAEEFSIGLDGVYARLLPVAAIALAALTLLVRVLPAAARVWVIGVGLALGAALYAQSHLMVWNYGRFDGTGIDWDAHRWHGMVDVFVWTCLIVFGAIARRHLARHAVFLGGVLLLIQVASAVLAVQANDVSWRAAGDDTMDEGFYELSPERNAVVIVLDAFKTPVFEQVMERRPGLADEFTGFTFFRDAISVLPTTWMSIPAMLTGETYHNEQSGSEFLETVFARRSVVSKLDGHGYRTDLVTLGRYCRRLEADTCLTPGELVNADRNALRREETVRLGDLVLFRYLPQVGKRLVYSEDQMLLTSWLAPTPLDINWHLAEALGATDLLTERLHVGDGPPTFKFIHLMVPHHPYQLDRQCRPLPEDRRQKKAGGPMFVEQGECAVRLTIRLLRALKSLDAYEQSAIIVVADHGFADREHYDSAEAFARNGIDRALPLLMVKPPGAQGPMKTSTAPGTNADVARTTTDLLGLETDLPGANLMALDQDTPRTRRYYHYVWTGDSWGNDYLPPIQEYILEGAPRDPAAWREGNEYPPGATGNE